MNNEVNYYKPCKLSSSQDLVVGLVLNTFFILSVYLQVTGVVHITTQKDDIKVAKIILEVTGTLNTKLIYRWKTRDGMKSKWLVNVRRVNILSDYLL